MNEGDDAEEVMSEGGKGNDNMVVCRVAIQIELRRW